MRAAPVLVVLLGAPAFAADAVAPAAAASAVAASASAAAAVPAAPAAAASAAAPEPAPAASAAASSAVAASASASAPATLGAAPVVAPPRPMPAPRSRKSELVQISDPYIEMRTGPGRGYPIFFVAPRSDWIEIELRHTDWFRIRTEDDKVGWVSRQQLESTLTAAGSTKTFRDVRLDDYLSRKVQLGAAWGHFKSEPMLKLWTSYRLSDTLSLEGTIGQVQGVFSGTDIWHVDVLIEPWSDHRLSPFLGVGVGKFKNFPNQSLIGAVDTNAKLAVARVGLRYYLTERFVMSADYAIYTAFVSDQKTNEYRAWTAGLAFFF
jgi:SH3-like domain-containing protein